MFDLSKTFWLVAEIMDASLIPYTAARRSVRDGDVLLFRRGRGLLGRMITVAGRSEYSHAAMAAWWGERLMCLETVQWHGGRAVLLSTLLEAAPGLIDVYGPRSRARRFRRQDAVEAMIELTGRRYGWPALFAAAMLHLPFLRFLVRVETDDEADGHLPFCSQAVAWAYRRGGLDPVPNLADRLTEPGDLARSAALQYRFTIAPPPQPPDPATQEVA